MAFVTIDSSAIQVGDPIKAELFVQIKDNLDDLDTRVTNIAAGQAKIDLINKTFQINEGPSSSSNYFCEVKQSCIATEGAIQLFSKNSISSGSLTIDIKKNTTTNPSGFNSIFTTLPTLDFSTATDFQRQTGIIAAAYQNLSVGDILRVDVTSIPTGLSDLRVILTGELS